MAWDIGVSGTVSLDDVTTPMGRRREQPGGSALYFALAASRFARVHMSAVVGADAVGAVRATLSGANVDLSGLEVDERPNRRWYAVHDFERWLTASESSDEGASAAWVPRITPAVAAADVLFLGSMAPHQQLAVLEASRPRLVGIDSMVVHIRDDPDRLWAVIEGSDVLFLNRRELSALMGCPEEQWLEPAQALCGRGRLRAVVVKGGPLGVACVTGGEVVEREAAAVSAVIDPTGAGDSLAGGFLGACAAAENDSLGFFGTALDVGLRCAADVISDFGPARLQARTPSAR